MKHFAEGMVFLLLGILVVYVLGVLYLVATLPTH